MEKKYIKQTNYAFIDAQNLNLGIQSLGWKLDFGKFRTYLKEKYLVKKAYMFIGYIQSNANLYRFLQEKDFILVFKPVLETKDGQTKGNVDADLVLHTMIEYPKYDKAIIVTSDGDFYSLVDYLYRKNKLRVCLSPNYKKCSALLKTSAKEKIDFLNNLKGKLAYKMKKHRQRTEPIEVLFPGDSE